MSARTRLGPGGYPVESLVGANTVSGTAAGVLASPTGFAAGLVGAGYTHGILGGSLLRKRRRAPVKGTAVGQAPLIVGAAEAEAQQPKPVEAVASSAPPPKPRRGRGVAVLRISISASATGFAAPAGSASGGLAPIGGSANAFADPIAEDELIVLLEAA